MNKKFSNRWLELTTEHFLSYWKTNLLLLCISVAGSVLFKISFVAGLMWAFWLLVGFFLSSATYALGYSTAEIDYEVDSEDTISAAVESK